MAIVLKDRVKETSTTTGTSDFVLAGAVGGFQSFAAVGNGNITYYAAVDPATGAWEVGKGTYSTTGPTLTRDTIYESSAAGAKISFGAGPKDVFVTYPAERAIYEEPSGNTLIDGGPLTVVGNGVTSYTSFAAVLAELYGNVNSFAQMYAQNLNDGSEASADLVAYNDLGDGLTNFVDMGINSSNYSSATYPIFTAGSAYLFNDGGEMFVGSATDDVVLFAGGVDTTDEAVRIDKTTKAVTTVGDVNVGGALDVTGAATFDSTVLLSANPTTALQAATKQYVDNQVTAGLHIHNPVLVETTGNLTATYAQGGTTFNITDITSGTTVTTSVNHGLSVNDQIWLYNTAGNGLSTNTAYFVYSTPAANQLTLSLTYGGAQITGLTNASGLTYNTRANSGVGATLTNAGTQVALSIDGVAMSTNDRVMVRLQTTGYENGVYVVTTVGNGSTNWVLTRSADCNKVDPADPNGVGTGDYFFTQSGVINAGDSHVLTTEPNTMIIGYTTLTYTQFSGSVDYTGGTNIDITGQTISLTGTVAATNGGTGVNTVTTGDLLYGSATNTWSKLSAGSAYKSLVMNAGGTNVEWNAVALDQSGSVSGALPATNGGTGIASYAQGEMLYANTTNQLDKVTANTTTTKKFLGQTGTGTAGLAPTWAQPDASDITGLAPSATTDTTNASNITSGTLPTGRLTGSYTGITGVGTLAAGTWNANTIGATYGGTGNTSYAVGDLLYADTTTSLAKLADVATGNALISGGVGSAPSWGKVGLATHVSGTLPIANGGTNGSATPTAGGVPYGTGTAYDFTSAGTSGQVLTSAGTSAPTWTSQSAISVGTATNIAGGAANQVVYQSASGTTAFVTAPTTSNTSLTWNGSAFVWQTSGSATLQNDVSTNTTYYPVFATTTSGAFTDARVANTKLTFNPNTGTLGATVFSGPLISSSATAVQPSYQAAFNTTTPGLGTYGVHFNGQTTADYAAGITWNGGSGTTTNAQAGIYVQGSGAYGTKMFLATTDAYVSGAKTAISIDHLGNTNFVRARPTALGNTILDAGNFSSYAVPTASTAYTSGFWMFNNMGNNHGTYTDANSIPGFGVYYLQGTTNGPGNGNTQWYGMTLGLGADYSYSSYACQFAIPRTPLAGNPYLAVRYKENGSWGSWSKIYAGYADSSGSVTLGSGSITTNVWAGGGGYPGYSYSGGNYRFGFSSTGGVIDVYADGNFYATDSSYLVLNTGNYTSYALERAFAYYNAPYAQGSGSIYTGRSVPYYGSYTYNCYGDPNAPSYYFCGQGFGNGASGAGEIGVNWVSGTGGGLWYRSLRDCCTNWSGWARVIDEYNYAGYIVSNTSDVNLTSYALGSTVYGYTGTGSPYNRNTAVTIGNGGNDSYGPGGGGTLAGTWRVRGYSSNWIGGSTYEKYTIFTRTA